jgi:hypothetical protein
VYKPGEIFYKIRSSGNTMSRVPRPPAALPEGVPSFQKKRRLLNDAELRPELCREYGEKFWALGWWEDALEFFLKGNEAQGLERIKNHCLETGDAYLLARLGLRQEPKTWRSLAERALELGKLRFARRAYELAGEADKVAMVEGLIAGSGADSLDKAD